MPSVVELKWYWNSEKEECVGLYSAKDRSFGVILKPGVFYSIGPETEFTKDCWEAWWSGKPLKITFHSYEFNEDALLLERWGFVKLPRPNTRKPLLLTADKIEAATPSEIKLAEEGKL